MDIKTALESYRIEKIRMMTLNLEKDLLKNFNDENKKY